MRYLTPAFALIGLLLSGCASGTHTFTLETRATSYAAPTAYKANALKVTVSDQRKDGGFSLPLTPEATTTAQAELEQALKSSHTVVVMTDSAHQLGVEAELTKLEWVVPDYKAMLKKIFAASFLTGGLGGVAYGSTDTPVYGNAELKVRVRLDGTEILSKEYTGHVEEHMAKLKCDTPETKTRVAGLALAESIDKAVKDISEALRKAAP